LLRTGGFFKDPTKNKRFRVGSLDSFYFWEPRLPTGRNSVSCFCLRTADQGSMYLTLTHHQFFLQKKERTTTTTWHWVKLETSVVLACKVQPGYMVLVSILVLKNLPYQSGMTWGNTNLVPISVWYET
jgi:hypothetical protein